MAGGTPLIGLSKFHYAPLLKDDSTSATYDTTVSVPNITSLELNPNSELATFFADDGPREVYGQIGEIEVTINVADLSPADYAFLIGASHSGGVVDYKTTASAPYVAIAFRAQKANGKYRYMWVQKGKFVVPSASHQTKADSVNFQPQEIVYKGVAREYDDLAFRRADSDDTTASTDLFTNWFTNPDVTGTAISSLTVTPSPVDGATGVAVGSAITWTYNNELNTATVIDDNFYLMDSAGNLVAGALSTDSANKVVTFTPDVNLGALTDYIATASNSVKDVYGQQVGQNTITNFTTA
jgi:phi13 family phage major tail protein